MIESEFDRRLSDWLADGPSGPSEWVLESVIGHTRRHPRGASLRVRWSDAMNSLLVGRPAGRSLRLTAVIALAAVLTLALLGILVVGSQLRAVAPIPPPELALAPSLAPSPPASRASSTVYTCPPGTDPDRPGSVDGERPPIAYRFVLDRQSGRLVTAGGLDIWTFDLCTNTWHRTTASGAWSDPEVLAYDSTNDLVVMFGGRPMTYDDDSDTLRVRDWQPSYPYPAGRLWVDRTIAGQLVGWDHWSSRLWMYDVADDTWQEVVQRGDVPAAPESMMSPFHGALAYEPSLDRLVLYVTDESSPSSTAATYEFDFNSSTWTRQLIDTPVLETVGWGSGIVGGSVYDEVHSRILVAGERVVIAYDAATHRWETLPVAGVSLGAYDPANRRFVAVGGDGSVEAWDVDTFKRKQLLAPTGS